MRIFTKKLFYALALGLFYLTGHAQTINVDVSKKLSNVSRKPLGLGICYLTDSELKWDSTNVLYDNLKDRNIGALFNKADISTKLEKAREKSSGLGVRYLTEPKSGWNRPTTLSARLKELHIKTLRFPWGHLADNYLWDADGDWGNTLSPAIAVRGASLAPTKFSWAFDPSDPDTLLLAKDMDFNEFMDICKRNDITDPIITVNILAQTYGSKAYPTSRRVTAAYLKESAVEWVKYAKAHGFGGKRWQLGNEVEAHIDQNSYLSLYNEFYTAMKAADSTIKIGPGLFQGGGGFTPAFLAPGEINKVDFLSVHQYTFGNSDYSSYNNWKESPFNGIPKILSLQQAIKASGRPNLPFVVTEMSVYGAITDSQTELWNGLAFAEMALNTMDQSNFSIGHFWTTISAWPGVDADGNMNDGLLASCFTPQNDLKPTATAIKFINQFLLDNMVAVNYSSEKNSAFSSLSSDGDSLSIYILNKDNIAANVTVNTPGFLMDSVYEKWVMTDTNPEATTAQISQTGTINIENYSSFTTHLSPYSLTVVKLSRIKRIGVVEDARVESQTANQRATNYGNTSPIQVKGQSGQLKYSFLKFVVSGTKEPINSAVIKLYAENNSLNNSQLFLYKVDPNAWQEDSITWNNKPNFDDLVTTLPTASISADHYVLFDVSSVIKGDGVYAFAITTNSPSNIAQSFTSREGLNQPLLEINSLPIVSQNYTSIADSKVESQTTEMRNANYGSDAFIQVKGISTALKYSYLKFTVSNFSGTVSSAKLNLYTLNNAASNSQLYIYKVPDNTWLENVITWNNRPDFTDLIATLDPGTIVPNEYLSFDVSNYINGNGTYSFVVATNSTNYTAQNFSSREGSNPPYLELKGISTLQQLSTTATNQSSLSQDNVNPISGAWSIYENPLTSNILRIKASTERPALVSISDLSGKMIYKKKIDLSNGYAEIILDSKPTKGIYLVDLEGFGVKELLVQN